MLDLEPTADYLGKIIKFANQGCDSLSKFDINQANQSLKDNFTEAEIQQG